MKKSHVFVLATLIAVGATFGTYALTRTTELGVQAQTASKQSTEATIAARTRQLNALEASLQKALAKKPPRLPALPKVKAQPAQPSVPAYTPAPVVSRPAPVTVTRAATPVSQVKQAPAPAREHESSGGEHDD
ncbi:MAG: hypothetical protein WBQ14_06825 [Gaiellaceae bacterium]